MDYRTLVEKHSDEFRVSWKKIFPENAEYEGEIPATDSKRLTECFLKRFDFCDDFVNKEKNSHIPEEELMIRKRVTDIIKIALYKDLLKFPDIINNVMSKQV
jgi:hypothetical protein